MRRLLNLVVVLAAGVCAGSLMVTSGSAGSQVGWAAPSGTVAYTRGRGQTLLDHGRGSRRRCPPPDNTPATEGRIVKRLQPGVVA